jgi:hypothetical protein
MTLAIVKLMARMREEALSHAKQKKSDKTERIPHQRRRPQEAYQEYQNDTEQAAEQVQPIGSWRRPHSYKA